MKSTLSQYRLIALAAMMLLMPRSAVGSDQYAYDVTSTGQLGLIDLNTAVFTQIAVMNTTLGGLGVYEGGLYGFSSGGSTLYRVNPKNGSLTSIGIAPFVYRGLGSTTNGLYGFDQGMNLYSINPNNGAATLIASTGLSNPSGFGVSTGSDTLYITPSNAGCGVGNTSLYSVDTTTGAATPIGVTSVPCGSGALVFEGGTLYAGGNISPIALYTLNTTNAATALVSDVSGTAGYFYGLAPQDAITPLEVAISVKDVTTGKRIRSGQTLTSSDNFQVTVSTNNVDCAGQFVVTALGAPGAPPSVLVQIVPYIIGPNSGGNTVSGGILTAGVLPSGYNDWKISTSCNGARGGQFAFGHVEFFVNVSQ